MGPWITFTKPQWNEWGRLAEHLRVRDLKDLGSIGEITVDDARRYHTSTFSIGMGAGRRFVRHVDLSNRSKIMDIGGGSGAYCIYGGQCTRRTSKGVVLDLAPVVCEVAREFLAEQWRRRPRRGTTVRLHERSVPDGLRCRDHGLEPADVRPRRDRRGHREGARLRCCQAVKCI